MKDVKPIKDSKLKIFFKNAMGVSSTALAIIAIYLLLWTTGRIDPLSSETIIEFCVVFGLTIYTKIFWYKDTEIKVRNTEEYIENKTAVLDALDEVTDIEDFDIFIDDLNVQNYNTVVTNHCKLLTVKSYKLRFGDKLYLFWIKLFRHKYYKNIDNIKEFFLKRYCYKIENKASKIHKLSASRILTMSRQDLLDDRNFASSHRRRYIILGSMLSFVIVFALASLAFDSKEDVDIIATITKMLTYLISILYNIILTVFNAKAETLTSDNEYFRRLINIMDRYSSYKKNPVLHAKITYVKEDENADIANNSNSEDFADTNNIS
jgi:hypothetical protein